MREKNYIYNFFFIFTFFINSFICFFQFYFLNTTFYDLGIVYNQIINLDLIYQKLSFRPITYLLHYIHYFLGSKIIYLLIFLNSIAVSLPILYFIKKKKISFLFLIFYITSPFLLFLSKNFFHSDVFFLILALINLDNIKKNNLIFYISLVCLFLIKDVLFYIHLSFLLIYYFYTRYQNILEKIIFYFFFSKIIFLIVSIITVLLFIFFITKDFFFVIYAAIYFFILNLYSYNFLFKNLCFLIFSLFLISLMSIFKNFQLISILNHHSIIFFTYLIYFFLKYKIYIQKKILFFLIIINFFLLLFLNFFSSLNNFSIIDLPLIKKKISEINKHPNKIYTTNSINFYPYTRYYENLNSVTFNNLIKNDKLSNDQNIYIVINKKSFFWDDIKCNYDTENCKINFFIEKKKESISLLKNFILNNRLYYEDNNILILNVKKN